MQLPGRPLGRVDEPIDVVLSSKIRMHTQNIVLTCLCGVKVKISDFGVRDQGSIPTRSDKRKASPNKFFLKERAGK